MARHSEHVTGNFKLINQVNTRLILDAIRRSGRISRADLARTSGLLPATVGGIVGDLMEQGIVVEVKEGRRGAKGVGRPARMVELNDQARLVLAVDVEPDHLRVALTGQTLQTYGYCEYSLDRFASAEKIMSLISKGCRNLLAPNEEWGRRLMSIGVSLPGEVDVEQGISVGSTNMPRWHNVPIAEKLSAEFDRPVRITRSMHAAALAEKWRRPEIRDRNVLCLVLRTGVGISMLIRGNLYYGASYLDGEIGHTMVDREGRQCECGKYGCLETFISPESICRQAAELIEAGEAARLAELVQGDAKALTTEMIYELAKQGDEACEKIVRRVARYMGEAVAKVVQVLNPHELVVCGSVELAEEIIQDEIEKVFDEQLLPKTRNDVTVMISPYKERAALYGAAVLVLDEMFSMPDLTFPSNLAVEIKGQVRAEGTTDQV